MVFSGCSARVPDTVLPMTWNSSFASNGDTSVPVPESALSFFPMKTVGFGPGTLHVCLLEEEVCTFLFTASKTSALREL